MSFLDDAISNLGQSLAQTAVSTVSEETGYNVGGALNALFGAGQTTGGQNLGDLPGVLGKSVSDPTLLNTVLGAVTQQTDLLQALGSQLSSLAGQIGAIQGEIGNIQQLLSNINKEELYIAWQGKDQPVAQLIAQVRTAHQNYGNYIAESSGTNSYDVTQFVNGILAENIVSSASSVINDAIVGQGGQSKGLLELWTAMVLPLVQNGTIDYREAVSEYMDYYKRLAYAQLQATNLVMEAHNFNPSTAPFPTPNKQAVAQWNNYRQYLLLQEEPFVNSLFPLVVAAVQVGRSIWNGNQQSWPFTAALASMELDPTVQSSPPTAPGQGSGAMPTAYYAPSQLFREAEQLLANLSVTEPKDRRIVIYMTCVTKDVYELVADVTLTLDPNAVQPTTSFKTTLVDYVDACDPNWLQEYADGTQIYLRRFVFNSDADNPTLKDRTYQLTNLNGVNGLVPLPTPLVLSTAPLKVPFMSDDVVGYGLTVGAASPFDFMNFAAYTTPIPYLGFIHSP